MTGADDLNWNDPDDADDYRTEFRPAFRRQRWIECSVPALFIAWLAVAAIGGREWRDVGYVVILCGLGVVGLAWLVNWRCPSCRQALGRNSYATIGFCPRCGARLR